MSDYQGCDADQLTEIVLAHLNDGDFVQACRALYRLDFISHYGTGVPSLRGVFNLTHAIQGLINIAMQHPDKEMRKLRLVSSFTSVHEYDPVAQSPLPSWKG